MNIHQKILAMEPKLVSAKDVMTARYGVCFPTIRNHPDRYAPVTGGGKGYPVSVLNVDIEAHILTGGKYRTFLEFDRAVREGRA
jgi:hypothetical protein